MAQAVERGDAAAARQAAGALMEQGAAPPAVLAGLSRGMDQVTARFARLDAFLPELILAADALAAGVEVILAALPEGERGGVEKGRVVIGTVRGDIHDVGKTIFATLLTAAGFKVFDLGVDVLPETFIERAKELAADAIALSCLMTTALKKQREVIEDLENLGRRERHIILVGGGAVTADWAAAIGADGYAEDATDGVCLLERLLAGR